MANIFDIIKRQDVLVHHPYNSFSSVTDFVTTAAIDGRVGQERDVACRLPEGGWRRLG